MMDRELAATIARAAEIGKAQIWCTLFELLAAYPPTDDDQQYEFIHSVEDWLIPDTALPKLKPLALRKDALGGWAAALLAPKMPEAEIVDQIDKLSNRESDFNFINHFGPNLGARLEGRTFEYFLQSLDSANIQVEATTDNSAALIRLDYAAMIGGLPKASRDKLLAWSQKKSAAIRGVVCDGIRDIDDDPSIQRYLSAQLDRDIPEAIFALYLGINYKRGEWLWWTPKCTERRASRLVASVRAGDKQQRWAMGLAWCLTQRNKDWSDTIARMARTESDLALRRVLRALIPSKTHAPAHRIVSRALKGTKSLTLVEREFFHLIDQIDIDLDEVQVLDALRRDAREVLNLLGQIFSHHSRYPIDVRRIQDWIDILYKEYASGEWADEYSLLLVCGYLARAMRGETRSKTLFWANEPENPARDFVLGLIIPRISGVTTDDLTAVAAHRLLELYIKGQIEPFPSPGEIATERFIMEIVMPFAQSMSDDHWEREALERILRDAGRLHDRRYRAPWLPH